MTTLVHMACVTGVTLAIAGCQTVASEHDQSARIVNPDEASRTALQSVVDNVLNTHVTLDDNALTESSFLSIERNPPRTMQNPKPQGRIMEPPFLFRLVVNGSDCILIDQRDRGRYLLENTICEAE